MYKKTHFSFLILVFILISCSSHKNNFKKSYIATVDTTITSEELAKILQDKEQMQQCVLFDKAVYDLNQFLKENDINKYTPIQIVNNPKVIKEAYRIKNCSTLIILE